MIDARSLALGRAVAQRLSADPSLVSQVRSTLERWLTTCSPRVRPALLEWDTVLQMPLGEIVGLLTGEDERAVRLRQSNPFAGSLPPAERTAILKEFAGHDQGAA